MVQSWFLILFWHLYFLIGVFNPFTFIFLFTLLKLSVIWICVLFLYFFLLPSFVVSRYFLVYHFHSFVDFFFTIFVLVVFLVIVLNLKHLEKQNCCQKTCQSYHVDANCCPCFLLPARATGFWKPTCSSPSVWWLILPLGPNLACCSLSLVYSDFLTWVPFAVINCDLKAFWTVSIPSCSTRSQ